MALTPIDSTSITNAKIGSIVGDAMTGTAQQNKDKFDELPMLAVNKINDVISQLTGGEASISITGDISADGDLDVGGDATVTGKLVANTIRLPIKATKTTLETENEDRFIQFQNNNYGDNTIDSTVRLEFDPMCFNLLDTTVGAVSTRLIGSPIEIASGGVANAVNGLKIKGHATEVGHTVSDNGTVSLESNANAVETFSVSLGKGTYMLIGNAQFASDSTGRRLVDWYDKTNSAVIQSSVNSTTPVSGAKTRLQSVAIVSPTASTVYAFRAQQNTGDALSTDIYLHYVRIA